MIPPIPIFLLSDLCFSSCIPSHMLSLLDKEAGSLEESPHNYHRRVLFMCAAQFMLYRHSLPGASFALFGLCRERRTCSADPSVMYLQAPPDSCKNDIFLSDSKSTKNCFQFWFIIFFLLLFSNCNINDMFLLTPNLPKCISNCYYTFCYKIVQCYLLETLAFTY